MVISRLFLSVAAPSPSSPDLSLFSILCAIALGLVHIFAGNLRFLSTIPRSRWLSIAGGVSVAYVFVHILPDLGEHQAALKDWSNQAGIRFLEHHVYLVALLGLTAFYGLERIALLSRQRNRQVNEKDVTTPDVFWLHIASFGAYNALIGYLLFHRQEQTLQELIFFCIALGVHFVVNDQGLREHHKAIYDRRGRWLLAAAVFLGAAIGRGTEIPEAAIAVLFGFIAGGIILNILKEELPKDRESRFWAFALGAGCYTVILILL